MLSHAWRSPHRLSRRPDALCDIISGVSTHTPTRLTGPTVRREDVPLHDDVRWLAGALGDVIRRLEGEDAFNTVENLRRACRARRHAQPDAPTLRELLARVEQFTVRQSAVTARAFTLFFLLFNTAEQVHRVR